jgi:two-component system nitrogen regulation response regulator NtrX
VVPIHVPALRERRDDIPMLVQHFVDLAARSDRIPPRTFTAGAIEALGALHWPGNVRELRNTVERLLILAGGDEIGEGDVRLLVGDDAGGAGVAAELDAPTFAEFKDRAERAYILHKLRENDWNVSETARTIDMPRSNLYKKIERFGLVREGGAPR